MRKIYFGFIMMIIGFSVFGNEIVKGKVLREKQNSHIGITVELLDNLETRKNITKTSYCGDFKFEDIPSGKYILKITDFDGSVKTVWFETQGNIKDLGNIKLIPEKTPGMYIFSNILSILVVIVNFFIIYFIRKSPVKYEKKYILLSIIFLNFFFIGELIRVVISFHNESSGAFIWPLSHMGTAFSCMFLLMWAVRAPVDRSKTLITVIPNIMMTTSIAVAVLLYSWPFLGSDEKFKTFYGFETGNIIMIEQLVSVMAIICVAIVLFINVYTKKKSIEAQISKIVAFRMVAAVSVLIAGLLYFWIFSINEPFGGYYQAILAIIGIIMYWGILKYCYNFRYMRTYRKFSSMFVEVFKYFVLMVSFFLVLNILHLGKNQQVFLYLLSFIAAKLFLDGYFYLRLNKGIIESDKILAKLEAVNTIDWFCSEIEKELPNLIKAEEVKVIICDYSTRDKDFFNKIEALPEDMFAVSSELSDRAEGFDIGFKMWYNNEVRGVVLIKYNGRILSKNEFEFMIDFAKASAQIMNNIILLKAKENISINSIKREKLDEELMYIKEYAGLINSKTENEEIRLFSEKIIEKVEKRGKKNGV